MFTLTDISVVLFTASAINLVVTWICWQRRKSRDGLYLAVGMAGVTLWTLAAGFDYAAIPILLKVFFAQIEYTGYNIAFASLALFALSYAGYNDLLKQVWVKCLFVTIPFLNILLAWTNNWHKWLWTDFVRSDFGENTVVFKHGPGYIFAVITGYLMILVIIMPLWQGSRKGSKLLRKQSRLLFTASLIPVAGNLLYLFENPELQGVDWTPISISISGILFLLALHGSRLLDIVPIARNEMIERMRDCVLVLDTNDRLVDFNLAAQNSFGLNSEQLGSPIHTVLAGWTELKDGALPTDNSPSQATTRHQTKSSDFEVHTTYLTDHREQVYGKLMMFIDLTQRTQMEQALRDSETLFRQMFTEHSAIKLLIDPSNGNIIDANSAAGQFYGYPVEVLIQMNVSQINTMASDEIKTALQDARQYKRDYFVFQHRLASGEIRDVEIYSTPIQVNERQLLYSIIHDITERKRMEEALKVSQRLAEELYESAPGALITVNTEGKITRVNSQALDMFGYTREQLLSRAIEILIPPRLHNKHISNRSNFFTNSRVREMGAGMELFALKKDDVEFPIEIKLSPLQISGETFVTADIRDISERKQMDQALQYRTNVLDALNQVTLDLINRHEMDDILQTLLNKISDLLDAKDTSFDLIENDNTLVTQAATADQPLKKGDKMRRGEGGWLSWQAIDSGEAAVLEDYTQWSQRRTLYEGYPVHAIMIVPIHQRGLVIGTINVSRNKANQPFNDTDIYAAKQLAQMVALVLDNAQLYAQLQFELAESVRREKALHEAQTQVIEQQRKMATIDERQRMARDLHDSVNQSIHSLVLFSETLVSTLDRNNIERAREIVARLQESSRQALKETRLLLYQSQVSVEGRGANLIKELNTRLENVELRAGVRAALILEGSLEYCPEAWHENLFWITIEALNNSLKHAQAHTVHVTLRCYTGYVELEVLDDGRGFDTTKSNVGGYGLHNMKERAELLGGKLTLTSTPSKGTKVQFRMESKEQR